MQKTIIIFLYFLFASSIFLISIHFANPSGQTAYITAGGCCIFAFFAIILKYKQQTFSLSVTEVLLIGFMVFSTVYEAYRGSLNLEWIVKGLSLCLFYVLIRRINLTIELLFKGLVFIGIVQAVYGLGQFLHLFSNVGASSFRINGSFDNPAGFAVSLSVCFPFALFLLHIKEFYWKILGVLATVLFIVMEVLSQSRAGVIAIIVISGIWMVKSLHLKGLNRWSSRTKIVSSAVLIIGILVGLYYLKKDSADGRLLIWQCSARMIVDKPILGHGEGGFQREYMLYQANYFRNHPDSSYAMLADIVKHPFNEFLLLLVENGLVGGLLFGTFIFLLIWENRRNKNLERFYAMLCLVGVSLFACFSYPLSYPFVRLMMVFCAALIMQNEAGKWEMPKGIFSVLKPIVLFVSIALFIVNGKMYQDEYRWNTIAQQSLAGETKKVLPDYARLYKTMNRNGLFLYNYGSELNFIGEWNRSTAILKECANFYNDIDLQLQLADNYTKLRKYRVAEKCLILAHQMIPNRFMPLYHLVLLYKEMGKDAQAYQLAQIIIKKPIKVISFEVLTIQSEMKGMVENKENV
jgi:O-antigen polymerase